MTRSPTLSTLTAGLQDRRDLAPAEIVQAASALLAPEIDEASKGDFLSALRGKGETAAEIAGFAEALLAHAVNPEIDPALAPGPLLDVCGTGGDQLDLFNVSTTSMFVVAAGGAGGGGKRKHPPAAEGGGGGGRGGGWGPLAPPPPPPPPPPAPTRTGVLFSSPP